MGKRLLILGFLFTGLFAGNAWGATYYMPDNFPTLRSACAGMRGGDTLIIRNGTYSGSNNVLTQSQLPPSGTASNYTIIKAENDGGAVFPDSFLNMSGEAVQEYVRYEGLKAQFTTNILGASHVTFLRCAFTHNPTTQVDDPVFGIVNSSYILVEDCWAWGAGRYKFLAYGSVDGRTHHIVFRRCVARFDRVNAYSPMANFSIYRANQVALQNCIVIDGDRDEFWVAYEERAGGFYSHHGSRDTLLQGCMVINHRSYGAGGSPNTGFDINNMLVWDAAAAIMMRNDQGIQGFNANHITAGKLRSYTGILNVTGTGIQTYAGISRSVAINNSIFYDISPNAALNGGELASDYNAFYGNTKDFSSTGAGGHDYASVNANAIDPLDGQPGNGIPGLKYPVLIESGSNLKGTGLNGSDRGATILYRIGTSGTYWGDSGWDSTTNEPLWPWPHEARIRSDMRAYSYTGTIVGGGTGTLSGIRGFCADNQSLTKYIWEYLGSSMPSLSQIYGSISNQSPVANAGPDQTVVGIGGTGSVVLDGSASADPDGTIVSYAWYEGGVQVASGVSPTIALAVGSHTITLIATDDDGATGSNDVVVSVTGGDSTAPVISNVQSANITSNSSSIVWSTNESANSIVRYGLTSQYGQEVQDANFVGSHVLALSGLQPSTTYHYQVLSADQIGNTTASSDFTFTTSTSPSAAVVNTIQNFEDGTLWLPGGGQDPTGNNRGWAITTPGTGDTIAIDNIGANGTSRSLKVTFTSSNSAQVYFRSPDKTSDHMPEAKGANRMSFYVRFPAGFPIQSLPFRYDTWQMGTYIHDPSNWSDIYTATSETDHGIHHYYHRLTIEQVGNGWVKYILSTQPDQAVYSGSTVPPNRSDYFDNFGRFYFHFGTEAGGPEPPRPFSIWIDEIKFYYDDGSIGGQVHNGGQNDAGFDGQFFSDGAPGVPPLFRMSGN